METVESKADWCVVLDLGADRRATQQDALYLESALEQAGIPVSFLPWHPSEDVLTPLGAVRPLQLLVPQDRCTEARHLVDDVLEGSSERPDVGVPVHDAWVLPYYIGVAVGHLKHRAHERGGVWRVLLLVFTIAVLVELGFAVVSLLMQAVQAVLEHIR